MRSASVQWRTALWPKPVKSAVSTFNWRTIICFLLPVLTVPRVAIGGDLLVSDLVVIIVFFRLFLVGGVLGVFDRARVVLVLLAIWIIAAIASDLLNESSVQDLARGWSRLFLFGLYLIVFVILLRRSKVNVIAAILGVAVMGLLQGMFDPIISKADFGVRWKFYFGMSAMLALFLFLDVTMKGRALKGAFLLTASFANLALNARSLFLTTFLSSILNVVRFRVRRTSSKIGVGALTLAIALLCAPLFEIAYDRAVKTGVFGEETLSKHLAQTAGGAGILLGGRSETLISLKAIGQKPLLGHGSWAEDRDLRIEYMLIRYRMRLENSVSSVLTLSTNIIPSHSFLFGSWVEHGVFGAVFWIYVAGLLLWSILMSVTGKGLMLRAENLLVVSSLWDVFFSPFGSGERCLTALSIAVALSVIYREIAADRTQHLLIRNPVVRPTI